MKVGRLVACLDAPLPRISFMLVRMGRGNEVNMADKNEQKSHRQTRKEYLLTRKQQQQFRQIRLALFALIGFVVLILASGAIFEYVIKPGQPVADINGTEITVRDFQQRVRFERVQTLNTLDSLYEAVGGDVNQLQQFAGSQLNALAQPIALGEQVLFQMIDEELIRQEAAARGITVSEAEIDAALEEQFNYFGGELPPEEVSDGPEPTPTITPIVAEAAAETEPAPTPEPVPTATAVSRAAYEERLQEQLDEVIQSGGSEASFRERVRIGLLSQKLQDAFAEEQELATEELQVNLLYIAFSDEDEARTVLSEINAGKEYLTAWNEIRSADRVTATQPFASEFQWTAPATISASLGSDAVTIVETLAVGDVSDVIAGNNDRFFVIQLRGRENRPIGEAALNSQKGQLLQDWIDDAEQDVQIYDRWQNDVPNRPILDPKYYTPVEQPTLAPLAPLEAQPDQPEPTDQ